MSCIGSVMWACIRCLVGVLYVSREANTQQMPYPRIGMDIALIGADLNNAKAEEDLTNHEIVGNEPRQCTIS